MHRTPFGFAALVAGCLVVLGSALAGSLVLPEEPTAFWAKIEEKATDLEAVPELEPMAKAKWESTPHGDLIQLAGNADDEGVRLRHLERLRLVLEESGNRLDEVDRLLELVRRWQSPQERLDFFGGEVMRSVDYDAGVGPESPLYPIGCVYRARMLVWVVLEHGGIYPDPEKRAQYLGKARRLFLVARAAFPENRIVRMYLGEPFPPAVDYRSPPGAPEWATWQREGIERLRDIVVWWIRHRMRPDGEYGGGWGDDCEMWRSWVPVLIGFDDPEIRWAQSYFSRRLLAQPHLRGGYHNQLTDVEHSAEDLSDALTPMMHLEPDDPEWERYARRLVELAESTWTGKNERGHLQFKSTYFTVDRVDETPARACDTVYHPRAVQPALLYWQRTGDPRMARLFSEWMRTWVDAAAREERGKPGGVLPTAIHWPDGRVGGVGDDWWHPGNYSTTLYDFPSAMSSLTKTLLLTFHMTGDASFLDPIRSMARVRLRYLRDRPPPPSPGSESWCAERMGFLGETAAKYRFLTGDDAFDELLEREADPYVVYRLRGTLDAVTAGLRRCALALRYNMPGYTSEVRYTDRVFRFPVLYEPGFIFEDGVPSSTTIEKGILAPGIHALSLLYSTATGDPGDARYFPMNAVRWRTPPRDIAALVERASPGQLSARLYHFGPDPRPMEIELYLLAPGAYWWKLASVDSPDDAEAYAAGALAVEGRRTILGLSLPARVECRLVVARRKGS